MGESKFQGIEFLEIANDSLRELREKARIHCNGLDPFDRKSEAYRYLPLSRWHASSWRCSQPSQTVPTFQRPEGACLVFVNGYLRLDLSNLAAWSSSVEVLPLSQAMKSHRSLLQHRLKTGLIEETDFLAALNLYAHGEGVFIYVPPRVCLTTPLHCIYLTSNENPIEPILSSPRVHLFLGAGATLQIQVKSRREGEVSQTPLPNCLNALIDVALEEESRCILHREFRIPETEWHFSALRATLKRGAFLESTSHSLGSICTRQGDQVSLLGEGAEAQLKGLTVLDGMMQSHVHIRVDHRAPHTQSIQRFKTLLDGASQSSFEGKILVRKEAQKTQAYQLNNNLLLDDRAVANSKPNLEIFADDVKASHGVTVTQLHPDELFYLRTRGLSESIAKRLLVQGFCRDL